MENHWQANNIRLQHYIARRVDDGAAVGDIFQEVYIKAHTQFHTLKSEDSMGAWLYRIAYNAIMDYFRQQPLWDEFSDIYEVPVEDEAELTHQEVV